MKLHYGLMVSTLAVIFSFLPGCSGGEPKVTEPELTRTVVSEEFVCTLQSKAIASNIVFSPNAERVAYIAQQDDKRYAVIDGMSGDTFSQVFLDFGMFSPDSTRTAYKVTNFGDTTDTNISFVIIDGEIGEGYDSVSSITFSPDSQHVAYIADGAVYLDRHMMEIPEGGTVATTKSLFFSKDNKLAYVIYRNDRQSLVVDGVPGNAWVNINEIVFSPDGSRMAYSAETEAGWVVVTDGVPGHEYDRVSEITFSPDGRHIAYAARDNQGTDMHLYFIVRDGREGEKTTDSKTLLTFSPDSEHLLYSSSVSVVATQSNVGFLTIDDEKMQVTDGEVRNLMYSPDGSRTAYLAYAYHWSKQYEYRVVVDDEILGQYPFVKDCVFSPDSQHVVYTRTNGQNMYITIDKTEGGEFGSFGYDTPPSASDGTKIQNLVFDSADTFHYLVKKDDAIYIIREKIETTG